MSGNGAPNGNRCTGAIGYETRPGETAQLFTPPDYVINT